MSFWQFCYRNQSYWEENTLNVNVSRIRKRLNDLGITDSVNTVRGVGYKLNKNW